MANYYLAELIVTGNGVSSLVEKLKEEVKETEYGSMIDLGMGWNGAIQIQKDFDHIILLQEERVAIKGKSWGRPPYGIVQSLSEEFEELEFRLSIWDAWNDYCFDWEFVSGCGTLVEMTKDLTHVGHDEVIVYVKDRRQLLEIPDWVPVEIGM